MRERTDKKNSESGHLSRSERVCYIYLSCKKCSKQYTRETVDSFRLRSNSYKSNKRKFQRGENWTQEHLHCIFYSKGHEGFVKDISITLIDKADTFDPS